MNRKTFLFMAASAAVLLPVLVLTPWPEVWEQVRSWYRLITDRDWVRATVESCGWAAPLVFIGIQVAQVLIAPIPGEATGFIGGYVFGTLAGFIYSSIGLTIGSLVNFAIGRLLGARFVRRVVPEDKFNRIDRLVNRQGVIAVFVMFVIPGFPKDYLSLALGMSSIPLKVFALISSVGRIPGTLMLSLQGASLYELNYPLLAIVTGVCLAAAVLAWRFRERLYRWIESMRPPA